jgi:hypothetical protein
MLPVAKTRSSRAALIRALLWLSVAAVWLLSSPAMAEKSLTPHSAEYKVKISVLSGRLRTELRATDDGYEATHEIVPTGISKLFIRGSIRETSHFAIAADGFLPTRYLSSDTLSKDKSRADLQFNWATGEVTGTVNDEVLQTVLEDLVHDRVSIQYELMRDLLNGGPSEQYILFDIDRLKTLNVRIVGTKRVKVPAGSFDAIGIQHQAENSSRVTTLWCVEELGFLPVLIEQHRKGKLRVRASLRKYEPATT